MPSGERRAAAPDLRLIVITDRELAGARPVVDIVAAALQAGAPAIQLRDKTASARDVLEEALELRDLTRAHGALLFVNDRFDVALAAGADGAHLGPADIPIAAAREAVPSGFLLGYSTDDPAEARRAERDGADYIGCGAVFGTATKPEAAAERLGLQGLGAVVTAVSIPVVGIGGITAENAYEVFATGAAGVAVVGAVMAADAPGEVTRRILAAAP